MATVKSCPSGHSAAEGQRLCITCGWIYPILKGEFVGPYQVEKHVAYRGQRYYLAHKENIPFLISEFIEFLPDQNRSEIFQTLSSAFPDVIQDYWHFNLGSLKLLYTIYPGAYFEGLYNSLGYQLYSQGLLPESKVRRVMSSWNDFLRKLASYDISLPAVHLDLIAENNDQLFFPFLHLCVSLKDDFIFPQKWEGVHSLFPFLSESSLSYHKKLAASATYSLIGELVSGLSVGDFYPEPLSLKSYRFLFSSKFTEAWDSFASHFDITLLLAPNKIYRDNPSLLESVKKANQDYAKGKAFFTEGFNEKAKLLFEKAREKLRVGPQIIRFLGLCEKPDYSEMYFDALSRAIREEPLACLYFEQAEGFFAVGKFASALHALDVAIEHCSFFPEAYFLKAEVLAADDQPIQSDKFYKKAIQQRPSPKYYRSYSHFLMGQNRYEEAQSLPVFASTGSQLAVTDEELMLPRAMSCLCANEHTNSLDSAICQVCQLPLHLNEGEQIGNYKIDRVIRPRQESGETLKGALYLCHFNQQQFFVKEYVIFKRSNSFVKAFQPLTHLEHPHLLSLQDCVVKDGFGYLIFPFKNGESLQSYLKKHGVLPAEQRASFFIAMNSLLYYLQVQKAVHGDIKPENIILTPEGPVLVDMESTLLLQQKLPFREPVYSFPYAPPEQENKKLNSTTDAYAFAITCIHAFSGISPVHFYSFEHKTIKKWEAHLLHLDAYLRQWIKQKVCFEIKDRGQIGLAELKVLLSKAKVDTHNPLPEKQREVVRLNNELLSDAYCDLDDSVARLYKLEASPISLEIIAGAYYRNNQWQTALNYLQRAIKIAPDYVRAAWHMADIYIEKGMYKEAIKSYLFSSSYCASFFGPHLWSARLFRELGEIKPAIQSYKRALQLNPTLHDISFELASLYLESEQYTNAEKQLRYLRENIKHTLSHGQRFAAAGMLAQVFFAQAAYREALKVLKEAALLRPGDLDIRFDIALNAFALKDWDLVKDALTFILQQQQLNPQALYLLAQTYLETREFEAARDVFAFLLNKISWRPVDVRFQLARAYTYLGELDKAQAIYEALLPYQRKAALYINLVNICLIKQDYVQAQNYLDKAQAIDPDNPSVKHTVQVLAEVI